MSQFKLAFPNPIASGLALHHRDCSQLGRPPLGEHAFELAYLLYSSKHPGFAVALLGLKSFCPLTTALTASSVFLPLSVTGISST